MNQEKEITPTGPAPAPMTGTNYGTIGSGGVTENPGSGMPVGPQDPPVAGPAGPGTPPGNVAFTAPATPVSSFSGSMSSKTTAASST